MANEMTVAIFLNKLVSVGQSSECSPRTALGLCTLFANIP